MYSNFKLEDEFNDQEGHYDFCLGSATTKPNSILDLLSLYEDDKRNEIVTALMNLKLDYSSQYGSLEAREAIVRDYNFNCDNSSTKLLSQANLLLTSGASEAIFLVFNSLFQSGDRIIVQRPIYQSLYQIARDRGVEIMDWDCDASLSFEENLLKLNQIFNSANKPGSHVRALVLNNPNNPTGIYFNGDQLKQITSLLDLHGVGDKPYLIVDEVFNKLLWNETNTNNAVKFSSAIHAYDRSIVISDLSKAYGFPGLRLGWVLSRDKELLEQLSSQKNYLSLRSNTMSEFLVPYILEKEKEILEPTLNHIKENLKTLMEFKRVDESSRNLNLDLSALDGSTDSNLAGLCIFPKVMNNSGDPLNNAEMMDFRESMLKEHKIFLVSGKFFSDDDLDERYESYIRLGLAMDPLDFRACLYNLSNARTIQNA